VDEDNWLKTSIVLVCSILTATGILIIILPRLGVATYHYFTPPGQLVSSFWGRITKVVCVYVKDYK